MAEQAIYQSKLVQLLVGLKYKERKKFRQFLESPYFNSSSVALGLFDLIEEHIFQLGNKETSKEYLWDKLHGSKVKYNDGKLRLQFSDLLKLAERYLAQLSFDEDKVAARYHLLRELNSRNQHKHFVSVYKSVEQSRRRGKVRNSEYYLDEHMLALEKRTYEHSQIDVRSGKVDFSGASRPLDHYYLSGKLRDCCQMISSQNILQGEHDLVLLEEVIEHVRQNDYSAVPPIPVYFNILMLLREEEAEPYYLKLKELVKEHGSHFPKEELWDIYSYFINYCIKQSNSGESSYRRELLHWYRDALEREILFINNYLMHWDYKNIVTVALQVGEYDWTRDFVEQYKSRIAAKHRSNAYTYNLARYYFELDQHDKVLRLLQKVEYEDVFYNIGSKVMLMRTYYDTEETDSLYSLFDSFGVFLRRNKVISDYHRTNYLNLIRYTKRLLNLPRGDKEKLVALREEVLETKQITDISWLLDKIEAKMAVN